MAVVGDVAGAQVEIAAVGGLLEAQVGADVDAVVPVGEAATVHVVLVAPDADVAQGHRAAVAPGAVAGEFRPRRRARIEATGPRPLALRGEPGGASGSAAAECGAAKGVDEGRQG